MVDIIAEYKVQISKLVNNLKTVSSRLIRKEFTAQVNNFYFPPLFWTGTAVSSENFSPLMANRAPTTNSVSSEDFSPLINNGE